MKKITLLLSLSILSISAIFIESSYKVGDEIKDFKLKNIDEKFVSLADYNSSKGYIIIFTCNNCPFAKAYEDRIIQLQETYGKTYPVIAINPNDNFDNMKKRAKEKEFNYAYLLDETQEISKLFGATKTPHVYLVNKEDGKSVVKYIGAIDNNSQNANAATKFYVKDAISDLESGKEVQLKETKAVGCGIKWKK